MGLTDMNQDIDFDKMQGLIPAIVQDASSGEVLILGFMNREAFEQTLQAGYVPRDRAPALDGTEQAVSLWRAGIGLRVLIVPAGSWVGRPRR